MLKGLSAAFFAAAAGSAFVAVQVVENRRSTEPPVVMMNVTPAMAEIARPKRCDIRRTDGCFPAPPSH